MAALFSKQRDSLSEGLGTFMLVAVSTSALTTINLSGGATTASVMLVSVLASALTFGVLAQVLSRTTGFFNPALSLAAALDGHLPWRRLPLVILSQCLGGVLASMAVALLFGSRSMDVNLGAVYPATDMGPLAALVAEAVGTAMVTAAVLHSARRMTDERTAYDAWLLASSLAVGMLLSVGVSGGALNPVRALAPQLVAANLQSWWIYLAGPLLGAVVATGAAKLLSDMPLTSQPAKAAAKPAVESANPPAPQAASEEEPADELTEPAPIVPGVFIRQDALLEEKAAAALAQLRQQAESTTRFIQHTPDDRQPGNPVQFVGYSRT